MGRFGAIAVKPVEFLVVEVVEIKVDRVKKVKQNTPYKPRVWRWAGVKQANKSLAKVTDDKKCFNFCRSTYTLRGNFCIRLGVYGNTGA